MKKKNIEVPVII